MVAETLVPVGPVFVEYAEGDPAALVCAFLSLTPPFAVCSLAVLLLSRRDLHTATLLGGALANVAANLLLKRLVHEPRPPSGLHHRPDDLNGWPSNHAQFCFFLASYLAVWALSGRWRVRLFVWKALLALVALAGAAAVAASRVILQYHTPAQVLAGAAIGISFGLAHFWLTERYLRPCFADLVAGPTSRWLRLRDCSEVDVLLLEYEAVAAASLRGTRKRL